MYKIILYNNGKRVKTYKTYVLYTNALKKYRGMLENNKVFLPKEILWDGRKTDYELVLTAPSKNKGKEYFRNEFGAMVKIKTNGGFIIKQVEKYKIEDSFKDKITEKKYTFKTFIKYLVKNKKLTYVLILMQNKLVIERFENEDINVLLLKNKNAASLLFETIKEFNNTNNLTNFIYFDNPTLDTKLRLYDLLEENYNISREYMQKVSTH
jgi:hypothetical protein